MLQEKSPLLAQSEAKRKQALAIVDELGLIRQWSRFGRPVVVGAVAHGLVWMPDIDMEVYCPQLKIEDGFEVMAACASVSPKVQSVCFQNHLADEDQALYWQIKYQTPEGVLWKVDIWSAPDDYALPRGEHLLEPMQRALTPESREIILGLKKTIAEDDSLTCMSIDLYRAVLDGDVKTAEDLRAWMSQQYRGPTHRLAAGKSRVRLGFIALKPFRIVAGAGRVPPSLLWGLVRNQE